MKKILIIEDDQLVAELERDYLEAAGYEVELCADGAQGKKLALSNEYALLLLDVMLPEIDGFEICREIRKTKNTPIIIVTARQEDVDKILGLGLGADDYMTKPFSPSELVARVNAHINIHERLLNAAISKKAMPERLEIGELTILIPYRRVLVCDQEIELKNKEFELLLFLASNPGIVFSKETLLDRLWGADAFVDTATVTVHVNRLREKIERNASNPEYIQTVWGTGYRFKG